MSRIVIVLSETGFVESVTSDGATPEVLVKDYRTAMEGAHSDEDPPLVVEKYELTTAAWVPYNLVCTSNSDYVDKAFRLAEEAKRDGGGQ